MSNKLKKVRWFENVMGLGLCGGDDCACAHRCKLLKSRKNLLVPRPRTPFLIAEVEPDGSITVLCRTFKSGVFKRETVKAKTKKRRGGARSRGS